MKSFDATRKPSSREQATYQHRLSNQTNQKADNLFKATENGVFNNGAIPSAPSTANRTF
jgi:hypothetical protein